MKHIALFCMAFILIASQSFAQSKKAAAYNNKIIDIQHSLTPDIVAFFKAFDKGTLEELKAKKDLLSKDFDKSIKKVSAMKSFEGDSSLKVAALNWFKLYKSSFDTEYNHILPLVADRDRSKEDHAKMDALTDHLVKREEEIDANFEKAQEDFSKKYNLELKDYPISSK